MSANAEQISQSMSDAELVAAAKTGQLQAFGELVERSQGLARAVAYSASGDMTNVEDLVQEALVTAWTRLSDLADPSAFRPWLAGIVRNTARYWRRYQGRHAPRAQAGMDTLATLASSAPSPRDEAERQQDWAQTSLALQELPTKYREPLVLYYSLGESHAQVAEALGLTEASARQRVHRARKKLATRVTSVERGAHRLATRASAAAGVLMAIESRQSLAATPIPANAATANPMIFLAAGALGGATLVAGIVGLVMLFTNQKTPSRGEMAAPLPQPTIASSQVNSLETSEATALTPASGLVSIGRGDVEDPATSARRSPMTADTPTQNYSDTAEIRNNSRARLNGRIKKHGPAVLREDASTHEEKPLMVPDIDMQAVKREFWQ